VRILLDTQVWLWMIAAPERLRAESRALLASSEPELLFSAASAWEIAIKYGLGKLTLPAPPDAYVSRLMLQSQVTPLVVHVRHALHVAALPLHHRDPFDRLLIAQAQVEALPIMTADRVFDAYDVETIAA
jgi:PIN domain nuclease of toxin-antitoxin system